MGSGSVQSMLLLTLFYNVAWVFTLISKHWHARTFTSVMPPMLMRVHFSMTHGNLEFKCPPSLDFCPYLDKVEGSHPIGFWRDYACAGSTAIEFISNGCDPLTKLYWASLALLVAVFFGLVAINVGSGFLYYYWFRSQKKQYRQYAKKWYLAGTLLIALALATYALLANNISGIFKFPTDAFKSPIMGYDGISLDSAAFTAVFLVVSMTSLPILLTTMVGEHPNEADTEAKKVLKEDTDEYFYGTMAYGETAE